MKLTLAHTVLFSIAIAAGCTSDNGGLPIVLAQPVAPTIELREPILTEPAIAKVPTRRPSAVAATPKNLPAKALPVAPVRALEPPLDVAALKLRLKNTDAIGLYTKLALKNQVDDLLKQFRAHYLDGQKTSVTKLRPPYDLLLLKVLALLQDNDPPLARTISGSREAIWGILADPEQFKLVI
jgi:hypothetical protein